PESLLPLGGYPPGLLPVESTATRRPVSPTVVPADTAFAPVVAPPATAFPIASTVTSNLDRRVVAGSNFQQQVPVAAGLDAAGISHWVKLRLRLPDGSIIERDPGEPWTVSVSGSTMTVRGRIESLPDVRVESIVVFSDDNTVDAVPATTTTIRVNPLPGTLTFTPTTFPFGQRSGAVVGTLGVPGASPSDTITNSNVPEASPSNAASLYGIVGNTLQTRYAFDSNTDPGIVRVRATNSLGFSIEKDVAMGGAPFVWSSPTSTVAVDGTVVAFGVGATGAQSIQWQSSSDGGSSWSNIAGATKASLPVTAASRVNLLSYRAVVSNSFGTATSSAATLTVQSLVVSSLTDTPAPGGVTLREAITYANTLTTGQPTITFDPAVFTTPKTLTLTSALPTIANLAASVSIVGPGANLLTIQGGSTGSNFRALYVARSSSAAQTLAVSGLTFRGFNVTGVGGAIYNYATLTLDGVEFVDNVASTNGGAVYNSHILTLTNCTFVNNTAVLGGGIFNVPQQTYPQKTLTASNATFTGNRATNGGAIRNEGSATLRSLTISGNAATTGTGGGISISGTTITTMYDVIVAGNTNNAGRSDVAGTVNTAAQNLIGDGTGASGIASATNLVGTSSAAIDAKLGSIANNGGSVRTMALLSGSPAIDAGDGNAAATDQRGYPRPQ
ncbi:MAG: choice-of-anchor Q domain-containing protein, partial [Ilumatobacteraceae bacterium]